MKKLFLLVVLCLLPLIAYAAITQTQPYPVNVGSAVNDIGCINVTQGANAICIKNNATPQVAIGSTTISAGAALDLSSQTTSLLLPVGTTGQEPTGIAGMLRYNSTLTILEGYIHGIWAQILSGSNGTPTCGTGCASIGANSTDARGSMVSGSSVSAVTLNFSTTLPSTPFCTISDSNTSAVADISSVSTSALTVSLASALTSVTIYYHCIQ